LKNNLVTFSLQKKQPMASRKITKFQVSDLIQILLVLKEVLQELSKTLEHGDQSKTQMVSGLSLKLQFSLSLIQSLPHLVRSLNINTLASQMTHGLQQLSTTKLMTSVKTQTWSEP